jgi:hypothetical protein
MTNWMGWRGTGVWGGLGLVLLLTLTGAFPSAAQDRSSESMPLPSSYQPLALAYLAAPYVGGPSGRAADFSSGKLTPGEAIIARFLPRPGSSQPWEGVAFALYKRTAAPAPPRGSV